VNVYGPKGSDKSDNRSTKRLTPQHLDRPVAYIQSTPQQSHLLEDEEGLRANTGLSLQDARLLFEKYCGANTPIPEMIDLIEFFYYLKVYPTRRQLRMIYPSLRSSTQALKRIKARLRYLADRMDDVQTAFEERREPEFQLPHYFGPNVSSCIDTFPICDFQVKRLRDSTCDILRQVLYKPFVLKVHVASFASAF